MAVSNYKPMQIKILNIAKFVKQNNLPRVKSGKMLGQNKTLAEDGLFSEVIFGRIGSTDRLSKMAYIELNCKIIQPYLCIALERSSIDFKNTISGNIKWKLEGTKLTKVDNTDVEAQTGLPFIYKNFDIFIKHILPSNGSKTRDQVLNLLKTNDKDEIFTDKWLIIPAGYRDINTLDIETKGKSDYDQINDMYRAIIGISNNLNTQNSMDMIDDKLINQVQQNINNIYRLLIEKKLAKKEGLIQKSALAKTISYSSGNVIHNAKMSRKSYDEDLSNNIPYGHFGVPVSQLVDMYYPFVLFRMKSFFESDDNLYDIFKELIHAKDGSSMDDNIEKIVEYVKVDVDFLKTKLETKDKKHTIKVNGKEIVLKVIEFMKNNIVDPIIQDKFLSVTRYPVDNLLSTQYLKPISQSTESTYKVVDDFGIEYELCKNDIFILAFVPNLHSLKGWGGDYDKIASHY